MAGYHNATQRHIAEVHISLEGILQYIRYSRKDKLCTFKHCDSVSTELGIVFISSLQNTAHPYRHCIIMIKVGSEIEKDVRDTID